MKLLHIQESRCAGRDAKTSNICPARASCLRYTHLNVDRQLGINTLAGIKVLSLPYVKGQACHYRLDVK